MSAPSFMDLALKAAENAGKSGEVPIGCVIVLNNEVVATAGNRTLTDRDPTAHAEMLAIRQASETVGSERLVDCDLYVTLEPCTMCAGAISFARIRRLYYGARDPKGGAVDSGVRFFASPTCHHTPEVYSAVGETEAAALLREFFRARRCRRSRSSCPGLSRASTFLQCCIKEDVDGRDKPGHDAGDDALSCRRKKLPQ